MKWNECHPISATKSVLANLWTYFLSLCYSRRGRKRLYPYRGGSYKLHSAAHTITMLSRFPIREIGSSFLIVRNVFSRLMACSTKMRRLAIVLVFCTSAFVNCSCPRFPGGIKRSALWSKRSSAIGHYRNLRGLGKSMVVFRLFEKLRYSNERSTIF